MNTDDQHRRQRELLGAYALGHLETFEATGLQAHLDGCPACRAELVDLQTVLPDLRSVDLRALGGPATPPPDLGQRILAAVASEAELRDRRTGRAAARRTRHRLAVSGVAAGVAALLVVAGLQVGRATAPEQVRAQTPATPAPVVPMEPVALAAPDAAVSVQKAVLIPHTWGVEMRFVASGLARGTTYQAWFVAVDGRRLPAGEFLGTGDKPLTCNMQAALLRPDARQFLVTDPAGRTVLSAALPA